VAWALAAMVDPDMIDSLTSTASGLATLAVNLGRLFDSLTRLRRPDCFGECPLIWERVTLQ
jgi:hypothetical protein